ncbi:MAG: structural protein P5 [Rikenellaceae bacterium]
MSRGLKNNNPGNIRLSKVTYKGEITSTDNSFKQFLNLEWGYRAMFVLIDSYLRRDYKTITQIIARYAPPCENHTDNYIDFVAKQAKIDKNQKLNINSKEEMLALVSAMSYMENGVPAQKDAVESGWQLFQQFRP